MADRQRKRQIAEIDQQQVRNISFIEQNAEKEKMMERIVKKAFCVIGRSGSTDDGLRLRAEVKEKPTVD